MGGGGSASGKVSHSEYLEQRHNEWLIDIDVIMEGMAAKNPYITAVAYNPTTLLNAADTAITTYNSALSAFDPNAAVSFWENMFDMVVDKVNDSFDSTYIETATTAHRNLLEEDLKNTVLPAYKGSMRTLGAVSTSAYAIGEAILRTSLERNVSKFTSDLTISLEDNKQKAISLNLNNIASLAANYLEHLKAVATLKVDFNRISIVAYKEQTESNLDSDVRDALWELEYWKYGANLLASISGGVTPLGQDKPSKAASALGGALSGAAVGSVGGVPGAIIGGVAGLVLGLSAS